MEMIIDSGKIGINVVMDMCQRVLSGREMLNEWKTSAIVATFEGKSDVMRCGLCRVEKLLKHAMKIFQELCLEYCILQYL